jgi:hypothetical protein
VTSDWRSGGEEEMWDQEAAKQLEAEKDDTDLGQVVALDGKYMEWPRAGNG